MIHIDFCRLGRHGAPGDNPPAPPPIAIEGQNLADAAPAVRNFARGYLPACTFEVFVEHGTGEGWITTADRRLLGRFVATFSPAS